MPSKAQIQSAYRSFLGRAPAQSELGQWLGRSDYLTGIGSSDESKARIGKSYQQYLGRDVTGSEIGQWFGRPDYMTQIQGSDEAKRYSAMTPEQKSAYATQQQQAAAAKAAQQQTLKDQGFLGGDLDFGKAPNPNSPDFGYATAYENALKLNRSNYENILSGYQATMANQQREQGKIQAGYGALKTEVLSGLQGVDASQRQAIKDAYAQQAGAAQQSMASRGLGNTTISDSTQRGLLFDKQKADIALSNQMAQLMAGYQSQLGMAGLGYQNQAQMQNSALAGQQLGWMNTLDMPYPQAGAYAQLAQDKASSQAQQALMAKQLALAEQAMKRGTPVATGGLSVSMPPTRGGFSMPAKANYGPMPGTPPGGLQYSSFIGQPGGQNAWNLYQAANSAWAAGGPQALAGGAGNNWGLDLYAGGSADIGF